MSRETTEGNILPFSYAVAYPMLRYGHNDAHYNKWMMYDKGSEKSHPRYEITKEKIILALSQIKEHILETPLYKVSLASNQDFHPILHIYLKSELDEASVNSVKARGVIYTLLQLSEEQKRKGVIAISTGTFAYILCFYGKKFGIPVTVVMPTSTVEANVRRCKEHADSQARVIVQGSDMVEAHKFALLNAMTEGLFYLDGNDHPNMIIGQATLGIEIAELNLEEIEMQIDAVILPTAIDGCGLTMAMALAIKQCNPSIKVFEALPTVPDRLLHGVRIQTVSLNELSITVEKYGIHGDSTCLFQKYFDGSIKVNNTEIENAATILSNDANVIDSNAAIGLAAIISKLDMLKGKRVLLPVFGSMDSSTELTQNSQQSTLESHAGPSRLLE